MLGIIANHLGMLVAMWITLAVIGIHALLRLVYGLRSKVDFDSMATHFVRPILVDVLPLIILSLLTAIDPTEILIKIWYFVAVIFIVIRYLYAIANDLKK